MSHWDLAVDVTALRPCAAAAGQGRIEPLDVADPADRAGPATAAGDLGGLLPAAAAAGAVHHGGGPARLLVVHPTTWGEPEFGTVRGLARAAHLPEPGFISVPAALARYFRARLALPERSCVAVYDARAGAVEVGVQRHDPSGPAPVAHSTFPALPATAADHDLLDHARARVLQETAAVIDRAALRRGELSAVYLTGQAAGLPGMAGLVRTVLRLTAFVSDRPDDAAVLGALVAPDDSAFRFGPTLVPPAPVPGPFAASTATVQPAEPAVAAAAAALAAAMLTTVAEDHGHQADRESTGTVPGQESSATVPAPWPAQAPATPAPAAAAETVTLAAPPGQSGALAVEFPASSSSQAAGDFLVARQAPASAVPPEDRGGPRVRTVWLLTASLLIPALGLGYLLLADHGHHTGAQKSSHPVIAPAGASPSAPAPTATSQWGMPTPVPSPSFTPPSAVGTPTESASAAGTPSSVVLAYFTAINDHDYAKAWQLGGSNLGGSYSSFVQGFSTTAHDDATAHDDSATESMVDLTTTQTDGSVRRFAGSYTVIGDVITGAHMHVVS